MINKCPKHNWMRYSPRDRKLANANKIEWLAYQCERCNMFGIRHIEMPIHAIVAEQTLEQMLNETKRL